jgi:predicted NUDIX family NTP pyrophosphohydrolase
MIPKGGVEEGEGAADCATREFEEELGTRPAGTPRPLCTIRQKGGKWVEAFALEGDLDADAIVSNSFSMEYPPRSGEQRLFPEIDRAAWFDMVAARRFILPSQLPILDALEADLARPRTASG